MDECLTPPCIHVVADNARKLYAVFIEDSEGELTWIRADEVVKAFRIIEKLSSKGFREAVDEEVDDLAYQEFGALPLEG